MHENDIEINFWRQHIIEGLIAAKRNEKEVISILKNGINPKKQLMEIFSFSNHQAQSLLDLKKPLDGIDLQAIESELKDLKAIEFRLKNHNKPLNSDG